MSDEPIFDAVIRGGSTDLATVVCWLTLSPGDWCIIGGMAVDAWAPPTIYAARVDVATDREPGLDLLRDLAEEGFAVELDSREQVVTAQRPGDGHRLRVSIHYGPGFCSMPARASRRAVLGCDRPVASLEDVAAALLALRADPGAGVRAQVEAEMHLFRLSEQHADTLDTILPPDLRERAEADRTRALA